MNAARNNNFAANTDYPASSLENLLAAGNRPPHTTSQKRGGRFSPLYPSFLHRPHKRSDRLPFRSRSLPLKSKKSITGTEHSVKGGDVISGGIVKATPKQKRVRALSSAASGLGGALGKLKNINFRGLSIGSVKHSKSEAHMRLLSDAGSNGPWNLDETHSRIAGATECDENSYPQSPKFSMTSNVNNPFNTPPPTPSTNTHQSESDGTITMPLSELTNDPNFHRKKEERSREKISQLLGDEAGVAEYEKMTKARMIGMGSMGSMG